MLCSFSPRPGENLPTVTEGVAMSAGAKPDVLKSDVVVTVDDDFCKGVINAVAIVDDDDNANYVTRF
jgi:hypothetical protein